MKTILVPTDYSDNARHALRFALYLNENTPFHIVLLHLGEILVPTSTPQHLYKEMYEKLIQRKIPRDSFRILMLTRQLLTAIKYLPLNHKFKVILFICKVITQANGFRAQTFKSMVIILAQRKAN